MLSFFESPKRAQTYIAELFLTGTRPGRDSGCVLALPLLYRILKALPQLRGISFAALCVEGGPSDALETCSRFKLDWLQVSGMNTSTVEVFSSVAYLLCLFSVIKLLRITEVEEMTCFTESSTLSLAVTLFEDPKIH